MCVGGLSAHTLCMRVGGLSAHIMCMCVWPFLHTLCVCGPFCTHSVYVCGWPFCTNDVYVVPSAHIMCMCVWTFLHTPCVCVCMWPFLHTPCFLDSGLNSSFIYCNHTLEIITPYSLVCRRFQTMRRAGRLMAFQQSAQMKAALGLGPWKSLRWRSLQYT